MASDNLDVATILVCLLAKLVKGNWKPQAKTEFLPVLVVVKNQANGKLPPYLIKRENSWPARPQDFVSQIFLEDSHSWNQNLLLFQNPS